MSKQYFSIFVMLITLVAMTVSQDSDLQKQINEAVKATGANLDKQRQAQFEALQRQINAMQAQVQAGQTGTGNAVATMSKEQLEAQLNDATNQLEAQMIDQLETQIKNLDVRAVLKQMQSKLAASLEEAGM